MQRKLIKESMKKKTNKKSSSLSAVFHEQKILSVKDMGRLIRRVRKENKITQARSARFCGVTPKFLSELENGKKKHFSLSLVLQVMQSLGIELKAERRKIK